MTKRRALVAVALLALVGALFAWYFWPRHGITDANMARVRAGMTLAEVEELFGVPPGEYDGATAGFEFFVAEFLPGRRREDLETATWVSRHGTVFVYYDRNGEVVGKARGSAWQEDTWLQQQLVRLGLREPRINPFDW